MIVIIRIAGMVDRSAEVESTLSRLRLRRKFACSIFEETPETMGMIKKIRSFVAYGEIDKATLIELIKQRGQALDKTKKIDAEKTAEILLKEKSFDKTGIKPFFRLHPARGGINSKQHFPAGVLGEHKEKINDLIRRML